MVALVDSNNFYVSCERLFRPDLRNRPVVVLSNNDGCVVSRSNEVKAMGIGMAEPWFKIRRQMEAMGVFAFSSNYPLYADISNRIVHEIRALCPRIEVYSIDESFLDLSAMAKINLPEFGLELRKTILHNVGIPTSVGIAATKTLAKAAIYFAKRHPQLNGVCAIRTEAQRVWVLQRLPIDEVWGIGRNYARWLSSMKIHTAWDFAEMSPELVRRQMKVVGLRMQMELNNTPCISLEAQQPAKKNIATTRSFAQNVTDKTTLMEAIAYFATRCAEKLRKQHSAASLLTIFLQTDRFNGAEIYHGDSFTVALPQASAHTVVLVKEAISAFEACYVRGLAYKKAGVMVAELVPDTQIQTSLFYTQSFWNNTSLCQAMDKLNQRYGRDFVKVATLGTGADWAMRQENLSPQYSTQLKGLLRIKLPPHKPRPQI
jgi:DNA polymerase V